MSVKSVHQQNGKIVQTRLMDYLNNGDFAALGHRPITWKEAVMALRNEMAPHPVIVCAATLFHIRIIIVDWQGVSNLLHNQ